jgi:branched-chain amino acid transport system permease protein
MSKEWFLKEFRDYFFYYRKILFLLILVIGICLPWLGVADYIIYLVTLSCVWAVAALSLNLVMGHTGQVNLGHAIFFGIGAYSSAIMMRASGLIFWFVLPFSALISVCVSLLIGLLTFRLRGSYYAICTLAFNIVITLIIDRWDSLTGGGEGIWDIPKAGLRGIPFLREIKFSIEHFNYYFALLLLVVTILVLYLVLNSFIGRSFHAVRENEQLAAAIGINVRRTKLLAYGISALFGGVAGSFYATVMGVIDPSVSSFDLGFSWIIFCLVGGQSTIVGPAIGAFILTAVPEAMQVLAEYRMLVYGVLLVIMVLYFPDGVAGWVKMRFPRAGLDNM